MIVINKLSDEIINKLPSEVQKYIFLMQTEIFSVTQQNKCLKEEFANMMKREKIISELKYLLRTLNDSNIQMKWYEEGQIDTYRRVLNLSEEEVKELAKNV